MEEGASGFFEQAACTNASSGYRSGRAKEGHIPVFTFSYPWVLLGARICVDSGPPPPPRLSIIRFANPIPSAHVCTATICPGATAGGSGTKQREASGIFYDASRQASTTLHKNTYTLFRIVVRFFGLAFAKVFLPIMRMALVWDFMGR